MILYNIGNETLFPHLNRICTYTSFNFLQIACDHRTCRARKVDLFEKNNVCYLYSEFYHYTKSMGLLLDIVSFSHCFDKAKQFYKYRETKVAVSFS